MLVGLGTVLLRSLGSVSRVNSVNRDKTLTTERDNWKLRITKGVFRTGGSYEASLKLVQTYKLNSCARWILGCGLSRYL